MLGPKALASSGKRLDLPNEGRERGKERAGGGRRQTSLILFSDVCVLVSLPGDSDAAKI